MLSACLPCAHHTAFQVVKFDVRVMHDSVLVFVAGSAVNQAGRSSGLTAPNGPAQSALVRSTLAVAHLQAADIALVSVHGTGMGNQGEGKFMSC